MIEGIDTNTDLATIGALNRDLLLGKRVDLMELARANKRADMAIPSRRMGRQQDRDVAALKRQAKAIGADIKEV